MELDEADIRSLMQVLGKRNAHSAVEPGNRPVPGRSGNKAGRRSGRGGGPRPNAAAPRHPGPVEGQPPAPGQGKRSRGERASQSSQPDPMKTAFGYIGADSFTRQRQDQGPRRGGRPNGKVGGRGR